MIIRQLKKQIENYLFQKKAILIFGPRQVGKTTLLEMIAENSDKKCLYLNCDEPDTRKELTDITSTQLKQKIGSNQIIMIDEAQRVKNIGLTLKLITDQIKDVQLIATGSSAFELSNEINEPLTGRKFEFLLLPFSTAEMIAATNSTEEKRKLEHRLVFGTYPDVTNEPGKEKIILNNLVNSYLFKDLFSFKDVRKPDLLEKLLESLALQLGSEVSINELSQLLQVDRMTIERYLNLLEKTYVIFRLSALSRNLRNEIKKNRKIYFYDNGVRNAIISDFNSFNLRSDKGALWENFLVSERRKYLNYNLYYRNQYFWRTLQQQEIDYIEEFEGRLNAYEFKLNPRKQPRLSKTFSSAYPNCSFEVISRNNYLDFLT